MTAAPRVTAAGTNPLLTEANPALGERLSPPMHRLAPDPVPTEVAYQMPEFRLLSRGDELPVFAFTTTDQAHGWDVFAVSRALRLRGWQLPAYTFPADREDLAILRIVCRNGFGHDLADLFLKDLDSAVAELRADSTASVGGTSGFHH